MVPRNRLVEDQRRQHEVRPVRHITEIDLELGRGRAIGRGRAVEGRWGRCLQKIRHGTDRHARPRHAGHDFGHVRLCANHMRPHACQQGLAPFRRVFVQLAFE